MHVYRRLHTNASSLRKQRPSNIFPSFDVDSSHIYFKYRIQEKKEKVVCSSDRPLNLCNTSINEYLNKKKKKKRKVGYVILIIIILKIKNKYFFFFKLFRVLVSFTLKMTKI